MPYKVEGQRVPIGAGMSTAGYAVIRDGKSVVEFTRSYEEAVARAERLTEEEQRDG